MNIRRSSCGLLLAVVVALAPAGRAQAAWVRGLAPAPTSAPSQAAVVVDAREVGTMSASKVADVASKATRAVSDAGVSPQAVRVTFVEIDPVEVLRGVRVVLTHPEAPVVDPEGDPRGPVLASCTACSDAELAGLAIEAVLEAIERHRDALEAQRAAAEARRVEAAEAAAKSSEPAPAPVVEAPPPAPRRALGPIGWAGVAGLGLGAAAVVTGAVLATRSPAPFPDERVVITLRDVRPPGYAVLGAGVALVITGAVLLIVDRRRARPGRLGGASWRAPGGRAGGLVFSW